MRLPRTWNGWKALFWITMRRCVKCHGRLVGNAPYDSWAWCMRCGGRMHPRGFWDALANNQRAHEIELENAKQS